MPDVDIQIGGRTFQVSCQPGEEHFLRSAAEMLDLEAQPLVNQMGRMPDARMLLMASLMLADKTAALEDDLRKLRHRLTALESQPVHRIEVPVVPTEVTETLAEIAARAEAMADAVEEMAAG